MRKFVAIAVASAVLGVAGSPTTSHAAVARNMAPAVESTRPVAQVGCYRWGETGYHRYGFCIGPSWLYPHHRVCRHGYCWYE